MSVERIPLADFHARLKAQGVASEDLAFICPMCGAVQSARSLIGVGAGATLDAVERFLGFSCVGRWTNAGPPPRAKDPGGYGCDWTLGGLFPLHRLEVVTPDGVAHPRFEVASADQAASLARRGGRLPERPA